ncbi:MAG TPA: hypothetical protein VFI66_07080 [Gemmatimonadales bacterium]|nr:hypothetical protein [Gemmatimonadales bacterium]
MATPTARSFRVAAPDGAPVAVRVTSGGGRRPTVVLFRLPPGLVERLARAGFATVTLAPETQGALAAVIAALEGGTLGVQADRWALLEPGSDGSIAVARVTGGAPAPGVTAGDTEVVFAWLVKHLV